MGSGLGSHRRGGKTQTAWRETRPKAEWRPCVCANGQAESQGRHDRLNAPVCLGDGGQDPQDHRREAVRRLRGLRKWDDGSSARGQDDREQCWTQRDSRQRRAGLARWPLATPVPPEAQLTYKERV
eukprot:scaffold2893_cov254-Pinguiococcus_pyrenoidosus.AAC.8